jgi:hypothetical protein
MAATTESSTTSKSTGAPAAVLEEGELGLGAIGRTRIEGGAYSTSAKPRFRCRKNSPPTKNAVTA